MSESLDQENKLVIAEKTESQEDKSEASTSGMSGDRPTKRVGRRPGRRSSKMDVRAKLERSRQSARECRARKKLRYQYLEDLVANREKAVFALRDELELYKQWCIQVDQGLLPLGLLKLAREKEATEKAKGPSLAKIPEGAEGGEDDAAEMDEVMPENGVETNDGISVHGNAKHKSNGKRKGRQKAKASTSSQLKEQLHQIAFSHDFKVPVSSTITTVETQPRQNHPSDTSKPVMNVAGFVSDLSKFSTIGMNYLESAVTYNPETMSHNKLGTITEESIEGSNGVTKAKETSLLPTFVVDIKEN